MEPSSTGTLIKLFKLITGRTVWREIIKSVLHGRLRNGKDPLRFLPKHDLKRLTTVQKDSMRFLIATIRTWLRKMEKEYRLK